MVGCQLANLEGILVTETDGGKISMSVNVEKFRRIVEVSWKESMPLSVAFPKMFNLEILNARLLRWSDEEEDCSKNEFQQFRWSLLGSVLTAEASIVADVAFLKWTVQTIGNKREDEVVELSAYDLKVICSLSLVPHIGKDCITDIVKVLDEIPKLMLSLDHVSSTDLVYALIALLKHLQSLEVLSKLEEIVEEMFFSFIMRHERLGRVPLYQAFGFYCMAALGQEHSFTAKLAKKTPKEQFAAWSEKFQELSLIHKFKAHSLGLWKKLIDENFFGFWEALNPAAVINLDDQTLNWDKPPSMGSIKQEKEKLDSFEAYWEEIDIDYNNTLGLMWNRSYLCYWMNLSAPKRIENEFKSFTNLEEFESYLRKPETARLILLYEIGIWETNFHSL